MVKGLSKLIIRGFVCENNKRGMQDIKEELGNFINNKRKPRDVNKTREQLENFFATYSDYKYKSSSGDSNSRIGGPWHSFISSTGEFENNSKVFYNTSCSGLGSYDMNGTLDKENLSLSYFEGQKDSPEVSYIVGKIKEIGFVSTDEK